ncbi:hypothetical protein SAMN05421823_103498 [Catalinimonas alkaloidigena]|uniref:Uncharacterized protein n=1 Tax=Catalinimonas alkaloidigena TaxID=1075417 RepID=A0A1G9EK34_9BACT|nr:hypothetical protein [Catalinimonas alkaloidigena]SDK76391.1 hypothetical protein SAMN05421823_103498 [Catalinimonas alkaloidigena]
MYARPLNLNKERIDDSDSQEVKEIKEKINELVEEYNSLGENYTEDEFFMTEANLLSDQIGLHQQKLKEMGAR